MDIKESIKNHKDGAILNIFVTSKADSAVFPSDFNRWRRRIEIKVTSEAKGDKANKEVIKTIAKYFNKSSKDILLLAGAKSREKTILIKNISVDSIKKRLKEYLDGL